MTLLAWKSLKDGSGRTALCVAAAGGDFPIVKLLLEGGAMVDECSLDGNSPLLHATFNGHEAVVEFLCAACHAAGLLKGLGARALA